MKAHLMFEDADINLEVAYTPRDGFTATGPEFAANAGELAQDLELATLLRVMAGGDRLLFDISRFVLLSSLTDPGQIEYRQQVLGDALSHPDVVREIYSIALEAIMHEWKIFKPFGEQRPDGILRRSVQVLEVFVALLKRLRTLADDSLTLVTSRGMTTLFSMLKSELDDEYFRSIDDHLARLKFKDGSLTSAELGKGGRGIHYVLRVPSEAKRGWKEWVGIGPRTSYHFELHPRDEAGIRFLTELNDRGVNLAANALAQSTDHILSFFRMLCVETGFYVSCLNLCDQLTAKGEPFCTPVPLASDRVALSYRGIYDVSLALRSDARVVGNDAEADDKTLVMITGANSGGKSTLLRSIGQAGLMMQCGMSVGAEAFRANVSDAIFTHFIREEDDSMTSGKLDEELARMSAIAEEIGPRSIILFNESFAATNEREGSEIARQIVTALLEAGIKVVFVTHQFTLANTFYNEHLGSALFLRAERESEGRRSFKLAEGEPLPTSFGEDLYRRLGGWARSSEDSPVGVGAASSAAGAGGEVGDSL